MQFLDTVDGEEVAAYALDVGAHRVQHLAELLQIGLAGRVVDGGVAGGEGRGHHYVGGAGDGGLVQQHI